MALLFSRYKPLKKNHYPKVFSSLTFGLLFFAAGCDQLTISGSDADNRSMSPAQPIDTGGGKFSRPAGPGGLAPESKDQKEAQDIAAGAIKFCSSIRNEKNCQGAVLQDAKYFCEWEKSIYSAGYCRESKRRTEQGPISTCGDVVKPDSTSCSLITEDKDGKRLECGVNYNYKVPICGAWDDRGRVPEDCEARSRSACAQSSYSSLPRSKEGASNRECEWLWSEDLCVPKGAAKAQGARDGSGSGGEHSGASASGGRGSTGGSGFGPPPPGAGSGTGKGVSSDGAPKGSDGSAGSAGKSVPKTCPAGEKLVDDKCVKPHCPQGSRLAGDVCEAEDLPKGMILAGGTHIPDDYATKYGALAWEGKELRETRFSLLAHFVQPKGARVAIADPFHPLQTLIDELQRCGLRISNKGAQILAWTGLGKSGEIAKACEFGRWRPIMELANIVQAGDKKDYLPFMVTFGGVNALIAARLSNWQHEGKTHSNVDEIQLFKLPKTITDYGPAIAWWKNLPVSPDASLQVMGNLRELSAAVLSHSSHVDALFSAFNGLKWTWLGSYATMQTLLEKQTENAIRHSSDLRYFLPFLKEMRFYFLGQTPKAFRLYHEVATELFASADANRKRYGAVALANFDYGAAPAGVKDIVVDVLGDNKFEYDDLGTQAAQGFSCLVVNLTSNKVEIADWKTAIRLIKRDPISFGGKKLRENFIDQKDGKASSEVHITDAKTAAANALLSDLEGLYDFDKMVMLRKIGTPEAVAKLIDMYKQGGGGSERIFETLKGMDLTGTDGEIAKLLKANDWHEYTVAIKLLREILFRRISSKGGNVKLTRYQGPAPLSTDLLDLALNAVKRPTKGHAPVYEGSDNPSLLNVLISFREHLKLEILQKLLGDSDRNTRQDAIWLLAWVLNRTSRVDRAAAKTMLEGRKAVETSDIGLSPEISAALRGEVKEPLLGKKANQE
jgi:hypothetical protein